MSTSFIPDDISLVIDHPEQQLHVPLPAGLTVVGIEDSFKPGVVIWRWTKITVARLLKGTGHCVFYSFQVSNVMKALTENPILSDTSLHRFLKSPILPELPFFLIFTFLADAV